MEHDDVLAKSPAKNRHDHVEQLLSHAFKEAGWRVKRQPPDRRGPDLLLRRPGMSYAAEIKVGVEGRSDRLIPLWSQACLQAARLAGEHVPLAVVAAPEIAPRVAEQILHFAQEYAPDVAAGVMDLAGFRMFRGPHLEALNVDASASAVLESRVPKAQPSLFSDLNQWMLKVLLAPEVPDPWLSAPRGQYGNASQLARAANVSVMSAFRFVQQLRREGYLDESSVHFRLVRRDDLFRRWQAAALRRINEAPLRFLLRGSDSRPALQRMLESGRACLALFAAADALGLGFVQGVHPYVYVRRLTPAGLSAWRNVAPVAPGEVPDVIVRQAPFPESVFRGMVRPQGLASCDVFQVWLDVVEHPARGREQAELIHRRLLNRIIQGGNHG